MSDRKLGIDNGTDDITDFYFADVVSTSDYYPFGAPMPGRNYSTPDYRYGFNGMEKDDEVKGIGGSSYDFGARMLDVRVGRWLSIDPLASKYPGFSGYSLSASNPILYYDEDGRYFSRYSPKYGGSHSIHVTNFLWVNSMTQLTGIPIIGLAFEAGLGGARAQDPSFNAEGRDFVGLGFTLVGMGSLKLLKSIENVEGLGAILLSLNRNAAAALVSALSEPNTFEIAVEFIAIQRLEQKGYGKVRAGDPDHPDKEMTTQFVFNKSFIKKLQKNILADEKATSQEGFDLETETTKRLETFMNTEKVKVKFELKESAKEEASGS